MMRSAFITVLFSLVALCFEMELSEAEDCKGCVKLDEFNFDKVINKFKAALVKFDVAFPYGVKHDEFSRVAITTSDADDIIVCEVGVKDFGAKDNNRLATRYGITSQEYPVVLLFAQGRSEPVKFEPESDEDFTSENIKKWIKKKSKVYLGLPGCIEKLDRLAERFKMSDENVKQEILSKAIFYHDNLPEHLQPAAKVYIKTMEKMLERGDIFIQTEQTRIENLLRGKLSSDKKRLMEEKQNILQSFTLRDEL